MRRNKLAWILLTGVLCLVLYTIVVMRSDNKTTVILGGLDGAFWISRISTTRST